MRIDIAAQTDIGRRKKNNEDSYGIVREGERENIRLFSQGAVICVADGLGGHIGGEIASKLAVSLMLDTVTEEPGEPQDGDDEGPLPNLRAGAERANQRVYETNKDLIKKGRPMGTTLLTGVVTPGKTYLVNLGDSRAYLIRQGEIIARTEDHSWVDEQVKQGLMSKDEAEKDSRKNVVTRCIGTHPEIEVDTYVWATQPGDTLLLCTDGLVNMVSDEDIAAEFQGSGGPFEISQRLVQMANDNGGKDNITVVVADISPTAGTLFSRRARAFLKGPGAKLVWAAGLALFGFVCFWLGRLSAGFP